MELKNIEKANRTFLSVKALDKEIVAIEKLQLEMFNQQKGSVLHIDTMFEQRPKEDTVEERYKNALEETMKLFSNIPKGCKSVNDNKLNFTLNSLESIKVLDLIIKMKQVQRSQLLTRLKEMGFTI